MGKSFYWKSLGVFAFFIAAGWVFYSISRGSAVAPGMAREFELRDSAAKTHTLASLKGQAVMIHFWASWCPPCLPELPQWLAIAPDYQGKPLKLVAISIDETWEEAMKVMPSKLPSNVLSLIDPAGELAQKYGTFQYPETYVLDKDHRIIIKLVGPQEWGGKGVRALLNRAIGEDSDSK